MTTCKFGNFSAFLRIVVCDWSPFFKSNKNFEKADILSSDAGSEKKFVSNSKSWQINFPKPMNKNIAQKFCARISMPRGTHVGTVSFDLRNRKENDFGRRGAGQTNTNLKKR